MSEEEVKQEAEPEIPTERDAPEEPAPRRFFTRRNFFYSFAAVALLVVLLGLGGFFIYRFGYFDQYVKNQFVVKMDEIGITFTADVFRTTLSPMSLELENATFIDKKTGEKLFYVNKARLGIKAEDLYAWQLSRTFEVETTDIDGLEVWVKFNENGDSNFSNLTFTTEEDARVKFKYASTRVALKNGLIHFGDVQRKITADAKNVLFTVEPENAGAPEEQQRYRFDFTSTDSVLVWDEKAIEPIDIRARGAGNGEGAVIDELVLNSPIVKSTLSGSVTDWRLPKYDLKIQSNVDLVQAANILPNGTVLRGFGDFNGIVSGEGETYRIEGEITSESLAASNIRLKGLQVNATVEGENSIYNANGKAIAEMLTFEDFQIDFPQLIGNVRGDGTNFKWVGELQAAGARTPAGTIAGLFVSDAVAEYKDEILNANLGNVRARRFSSEDVEMENLLARNVRLANNDDRTDVAAPNISAGLVRVEGAEMRGVNAANLKARSQNGSTNAEASNLRAESLNTEDARVRNLNAGNVRLNTRGNTTNITADNLQASEVDASGARVGDVNASGVNVRIAGNTTEVQANNLRVARVETDAAILGSLNVAGVRLTVREGRIEAASEDFNAGDVTLTRATVPEGGRLENVRVSRPVFVLEPSGRYRASLDMSLGGGILGSVRLGAARAGVVATNDQVALNDLTADVMDGRVEGNAVIATNNRARSRVEAEFTSVDLAKLLALQGGRVIPIAGETTGRVNLTFPGTNFKAASGTLTADFRADAGDAQRGLIPLTGNLGLRATNGLFDVDYANLQTEKTQLRATGRFDLDGYDSNLNVSLNSTDASEVDRLIRVLNVSPELEAQLDSAQAEFAGNLKFEGTLTGSLENPTINGNAELASIRTRGRDLGALSAGVFVSPETIELRDGRLRQTDGGNVAFSLNVPRGGVNNISVQATLERVNAGNLLAALPFDLPEAFRDFRGETSGSVNITGLPNQMSGSADLRAANGTIAGQSFDNLVTKLTFAGNLVRLETLEARFGEGVLQASGTYETDTSIFNLGIEGRSLPAAQLIALASSNSASIPPVTGTIDVNAQATGDADDFSTFNVTFKGAGRNVVVSNNPLGTVEFTGNTVNQILTADVTASLNGAQPQTINATLNFGDRNLPFRAVTNFKQTDLAPYIAFVDIPENVVLTGRATGTIFIEGNLYSFDSDGKGSFTTANLSGAGRFSELSLLINDTPFIATDPLAVRFDSNEITVENAQFSGGGSNVVVSGTKALSEAAINNLSVTGKVNLRIFDVLSPNTFFSGLADVSVRLTGTNRDARLNGSAKFQNSSVATFVSSQRISFERLNGTVLFTSNQVQIDNITGFLGGGRVAVSGGALLDNLELQRFRLALRGDNVTVPLPQNILATGDAEIEIGGNRENDVLNTLISGRILARRALYTENIDLADVIGNRREGSISQGGGGGTSALGNVRLDLLIEGRDALVVRNNVADLTASATLRVTGDINEPEIFGRVTASSGTIFFRNDRYEVSRAELVFPPQNGGEPFISLQAETEIQGYQINVDLRGELSNLDSLNASVRSNPALPQADVVSLITTGSLANSDGGIPTLAQTGINTAAEVIADAVINEPIRRATDRLFGLNRFEIDPIISGRRSGPSARLTVGRQINRNLSVTYSTNLSEDQQQVLALEYRVSNRLSFVAQYAQRSLTNVTRNDNNFSFEIRLRKRF